MTSGTRTVLRVVAVAFFIFFLGFIVIAAPVFWGQYKILRDSPSVQAEVVSSRVLAFPTTGGGELYDIEIEFAYSVDGRQQLGVIRSNHESTNRARKEKQAAQFAVGSHHPIRYSPTEPRDIRAQVGWNVHFFAVPIFIIGSGAIFGVVGLIFLLVARIGRRKEVQRTT